MVDNSALEMLLWRFQPRLVIHPSSSCSSLLVPITIEEFLISKSAMSSIELFVENKIMSSLSGMFGILIYLMQNL